MKVIVFIIVLSLGALVGRAQTAITDRIHRLFEGQLNGDSVRAVYDNFEEPVPVSDKEKPSPGRVVLSIFHSKNLYTRTVLNLNEDLKELDRFKTAAKPYQRYFMPGGFASGSAVPLFDPIPMIVTAYGIDEKNKNDYRFRVLANGQKELVPWQEPHLFSQVMMGFRHTSDGREEKQMAYLGEFSAPVGNSITVEVICLRRPDTVYRLSAVWIKRAPAVIGTYSSEKLKSLMQVYKYQWKYDFLQPHSATYYGDIDLRPVDNLLRADTSFKHDQNSLFLYLKDKVKSADLVEYNLVKDKDSSGWQANTFDPNLIWLQELAPGNYRLLLRYAFQRQTINAYVFKIKEAWYQTLLFKISLVAAGFLFLGLLYSFYKSQNQRKLLHLQKIKRQQAEIGLRSIRSQFNPHFVFNALNSIQGLVRKKDTASADKYLSDFSGLMQESLRSGDREMLSLDKELKMLESYVELEKLRFKFNYTVKVDDKIDIHTTEIPTLLLQPLIENAIRHGISGLYEKGILQIEIEAPGDDLQIRIIDNGEGFDPNTTGNGFDIRKTGNGYGILLTRERVKLLSELHPGQPVTLTINSGTGWTTAVFLFKNWLL